MLIWILTAGAALLLGFWILMCLKGMAALRHWEEITPESELPLPDPAPKVSILVPARNEEKIIEECLRSLLAQDYPNFEIIAVDDDSSDRTGEIMDSLAKENSGKLRVLHVREELPAGWVGKNYALTLAASFADGEWLLMSDGDIVHHPSSLSRAMGYAAKEKLDLLSLLPKADCQGFWDRLVMPVFGILLGAAFPIQDINDPKRKAALAAGGFILIRRKTFDAVGGYESEADHVIDDVLMAKRVKAKGFALRTHIGEKLIRTPMYESLADLWEGLEKNAGAAIDFRFWMLAAALLFLAGNIFLPLAGYYGVYLWFRGDLPAQWVAFTGICASIGTILFIAHFFANHKAGISPLLYALLAPLAYLFYGAALTNSFVRGKYGAGVSWKGRKYYGAGRAGPKSRIGI